MIVRIKGVQVQRKPNGVEYLYHRASRTRLKSAPGSIELALEIAELETKLKSAKEPSARAPHPSDGTLGGLIIAYRASPEFLGLSERTRADYLGVLDYLKPLAPVKLAEITSAWVLKLRDKAFRSRKRRFANYVVQVVRLLFSWGRPREWIATNPAMDTRLVRRPKALARANRPWTDAELEAVLSAATGGVQIVIALGAYAALREGDAVRFARSGYDGAAVAWTQGKTGEPVWLPAHSSLRAILDAAPKKSPVFAIGQHGKPFTESGFRASFFKLLAKLKKDGKIGEGLTFHGLRHTLGKTLAEAGCDTRTIAAVLGHRTETMARHYADAEDRKGRAAAAVERLEKRAAKNEA